MIFFSRTEVGIEDERGGQVQLHFAPGDTVREEDADEGVAGDVGDGRGRGRRVRGASPSAGDIPARGVGEERPMGAEDRARRESQDDHIFRRYESAGEEIARGRR